MPVDVVVAVGTVDGTADGMAVIIVGMKVPLAPFLPLFDPFFPLFGPFVPLGPFAPFFALLGPFVPPFLPPLLIISML